MILVTFVVTKVTLRSKATMFKILKFTDTKLQGCHAQAAVAFTLAPKSAKVNKTPFLPRKILSSVAAFARSAEINYRRSSL